MGGMDQGRIPWQAFRAYALEHMGIGGFALE